MTVSITERPTDTARRCFMYCGDDRCTCGAAEEAAALISMCRGQSMRTDLTAYTGPNPPTGFVGFVNLSRGDGDNVVFTVRSEGADPVMASYAVPAEEAVRMLREALEQL